MKPRISTQSSSVSWQKGLGKMTALVVFILAFAAHQALAQMNVSINYNAPNCPGYNSGLATAQVTGGTAPYNYYWSNGQTGQTIINPASGTLSVTVTDATYSSANGSTNVVVPAALELAVAGAADPCAPSSNYLTATVSGGNAPYNYGWSNGGNGQTISNLSTAGYYFVTITDNHGCIKVGGAAFTPPVQTTLELNPSKCGGTCDGSIEAKLSGGTAPFAFNWSYGPYPTSQQQAPAPEGPYTVTVTDGSGCTSTASAFLDDPDPITVNLAYAQPCTSPTNVTATAQGGTPPFSYQWGMGQGGPTAYNLQTGSWVLTVYDANGCAKNEMVTVSQSSLEIPVVSSAANCGGNGGGSATVNPTGGAGTYTYLWSNGQTTQTINNLTEGSYTVSVYDGTGCYKTTSVTVEEATSFTATTETTLYRCEGHEGTATVTISGGTGGGFSYAWNDPAHQTSANATDLEPGTYEVVVTDAGGCTDVLTVEILDGSMQVSSNLQSASCDDNGSAQLSVSNAGGNISYAWNTGATTPTVSNLQAGNYTVTLTDQEGCSETMAVEIEDESFELNISVMQQGCPGEDVGILQATITGGNGGNYTYAWSNWGQSNTIGGLAAGTYTVTATDNTGCQQTATLELTTTPEAELLVNVLNAPCDNLSNGNLAVNVNGGAGPFTYQWNTGATTPQVPNLTAGTYSVVVTDANGCTRTANLALDNMEMELALNIAQSTCATTADGNAYVTVSGGGAAPFTYAWSNGSSEESLANITAGSYSVIVTDAAGCVAEQTFEVAAANEVDAAFTWAALECENDGVLVQFNGTSSNGTTWLWNINGQTFTTQEPQVLVNQSPANVQLLVTSAEGCEATAEQSIQAAPIALSLEDLTSVCQGAETALNLVVDNPAGGTLTYNWAPANLIASGQGTPNPVFLANAAGEYTINVSVSDGTCTVAEEALMNVAETLTLDPAAVTSDQCHDLSVDFVNTGSLPGTWYFEYPSQTQSSNEQSPSYTYTTPGDYSVAFVPNGQCAEPLYLQILVNEPPTVSFEVDALDCADPITINFTNTSNVPGGITNFLWDFGPFGTSTDPNPSITVSGSQVVNANLVASFGNNCQQSLVNEVSVDAFMPPVLASQAFACGSNENVELNPGGNPGFTYLWSGGPLDNPNAVNPIGTVTETTTYSVVITAPNGCSSTQAVTLEVPTEAFSLLPIDNVIACDHDPVNLLAQTNVPGATFTWANDAEFDNTIGTGATLEVQTGSAPLTYFVMATDPHGCTAMTNVMVQNAAVEVDFDNAFKVCRGEVLRMDDVELQGVTLDDFVWVPENPLTTPLYEDAVFHFEVSNDLGCKGLGELSVKVVTFTGTINVAAEPAEVWAGQTTQLSVTQNINYEYLWSPVLGLDDPFSPTPIAKPEATTSYVVEVTDLSTGCRDNAKIDVKLKDIVCDEPYIFIPNAFTPNGDGKNDLLKVEGFNVEELYLTIYNRWGEKVFETSSIDQGWDGKFKGETVSGDVYGYYLKVRCPGGLEYFKKGNITVLR